VKKEFVSEVEGSYELSCGCKCEYINGKYINFLCDQHELEQEEMYMIPKPLTKFRSYREI